MKSETKVIFLVIILIIILLVSEGGLIFYTILVSPGIQDLSLVLTGLLSFLFFFTLPFTVLACYLIKRRFVSALVPKEEESLCRRFLNIFISTDQSTNQTTNQPTNCYSNQPTNFFSNQPTNCYINQSRKYPIYQPSSQSQKYVNNSRFPVLPPDFVSKIVDAYYPVDVRSDDDLKLRNHFLPFDHNSVNLKDFYLTENHYCRSLSPSPLPQVSHII
ncbi:uncharacterized protein LOC111701610 isoform X2 [Eurytemora carolleeae]|uniref:uncharacterized protein LOC111701610 isoform X2 n=1 Tax=Eurytemora carolleeae TaxID=1294199 RepID=UPI000C774C64|nr:uncharacterized protein LOC111701610 isoform X2 [Eurytemora carolleeae]|eukprot:XP_023328742.1 uncharacterized protein LOC111701610 isoform X2 [Eurytemora affinis]